MSKKILFVSNNAWSIINFRKEVIIEILQLNVEVHIISPTDVNVPLLTKLGCTHHELDFDNRSTNLLKDIRLYNQFKQLYKKISPDFIFHYVAKPNIYGSLAARSLNIPSIAVVTGLGYAFAQNNWLKKLIRTLYKIAFKSPKEIWFLNKDDAQLFIKNKIVLKQKVKILNGEGVNVDYFKSVQKNKNQVFTFLISSRLIISKGIVDFYNAILELHQQGYNCKGVVLGTYDANHPDAIEESYIELWKSNNLFQYLGHQDDVKTYLEQTDCFVFPSYYPEGVPRSLMEAASMKIPIITTNTTGCKDVVLHNKNGILISPNSVAELVDAMKKIYNLPHESLKQMGENGREHMILHFDVTQTVKYYTIAIDKYLSK